MELSDTKCKVSMFNMFKEINKTKTSDYQSWLERCEIELNKTSTFNNYRPFPWGQLEKQGEI